MSARCNNGVPVASCIADKEGADMVDELMVAIARVRVWVRVGLG